MILQALKEYYDRKAMDLDSEIAPEGFEKKEIPFLIVVDREGKFLNLEDTREGKKGKAFLVPRSLKRSGSKSYETTFLLWDNIGYVLGEPKSDGDESERKKIENKHKTWLKSLSELPESLKEDEGVSAVIRFYELQENEKVSNSPNFKDCLAVLGCNMSFRLNTDPKPVPCREAVKKYVIETLSCDDETSDTVDEIQGICSVTGEEGQIVRIHGETRLGKDAKSLVGIQRNSGYDSYGKEQGYNAPVIKSTEFAYVTALNTLLKSSQKIRIGNITTVFWSERKTEFENDFLSFFNEPEKDNPDAGSRKIKALYNSISDGSYMADESETRFYILGLSPNSARIAVRIWDVKKVMELATNIKQYFDDFAIVKPPKEPEYYSLWRILVNISTQDENDNIPPNLAAEFVQSIINGTPFPTNLLQAALRRIRSDVKNRVKPVRAAVIKGYLNRYYRFHPSPLYEEVTMKLNTDHKSVGYQLGRLFAVLEKIQEEANPGLNATIRERYYSAACGNPITVFPILMKLKNHHLAKMDNKGRVVNLEKLLGEIFVKLDDFPTHLALHEQGLFAVGYYHQRQNFYE